MAIPLNNVGFQDSSLYFFLDKDFLHLKSGQLEFN